jgi:hypothetical protein
LVEHEDFAGVRAGSVVAITEKRLKRALSVWTDRAVTHPKRAGEVRVWHNGPTRQPQRKEKRVV